MRVLVTEDDRSVAYALQRGLAAEGYAVDVAFDGAEGLWFGQENTYDVIVLDIMLPKLDGLEVCARLRAGGSTVPILMLTARTGVRSETAALDTGADDFLAKPFSYPVLLARLRALVRRGFGGPPALLEAGDLWLDTVGHRVGRGGVPIELTPRQFALLELLLRRAGEVLSKTMIVSHVWDFAFDGDLNIVEVYIRQLRLRVDEPFGRHSLVTVRGVGYRLDPEGG